MQNIGTPLLATQLYFYALFQSSFVMWFNGYC